MSAVGLDSPGQLSSMQYSEFQAYNISILYEALTLPVIERTLKRCIIGIGIMPFPDHFPELGAARQLADVLSV